MTSKPKIQSAWLGYVLLSKDTPMPQAIEEVKLTSAEKGPVDIRVMRPFKYISSPIDQAPEDDGKKASLEAYQKMLQKALYVVGGNKRSQFALYVAYEVQALNMRLVGFIYKV